MHARQKNNIEMENFTKNIKFAYYFADYLKAFSIEFSFLNCGNVHLVFIYAFRSRRNLFIKFMESLTFQQNLVENNFLIHCSADFKA